MSLRTPLISTAAATTATLPISGVPFHSGMQLDHLLSTPSCEDHYQETFEEVTFCHVAAFYGQCLFARIQATVQVVARFFESGSTRRATVITIITIIIIITAL